jgi:hypothetical protein
MQRTKKEKETYVCFFLYRDTSSWQNGEKVVRNLVFDVITEPDDISITLNISNDFELRTIFLSISKFNTNRYQK